MTQKKVIFIIPGFRHKATNKAYKKLAGNLRKVGYRPILVSIPWKQTTISQNTEYFLKKYKKITTREKYILGFSFGAMIAFLASTKVAASGVILCSLSPYFQEDLTKGNESWKSSIMKQRYDDFSRLHCATLAKKIKAKQILMLYGTKEAKALIHRVTEAFNQISTRRKYLIPVLQTEHNIAHKNYMNKIHQVARAFY